MTLHPFIKWLYLILVLLILVFVQIGIRTGERPDMREESGEEGFKPMAQKIKEAKALMEGAERDVILAASNLPEQDEMEMVFIPSGRFVMGDEDGSFDQKPEREVWVDDFYVDRYEVTFAQFYAFMAATQHRKPRLAGYLAVDSTQLHTLLSPSNPVVGVSWNDAYEYCQWRGDRLLTEAEWEKAASSAQRSLFPWGDEEIPENANLAGLSDGSPLLSPVGAFKMDRTLSGIHDLAGNAMEWVSDWYEEDYYQNAPEVNPKGPGTGVFKVGPDRQGFRVIRGASWNDSIKRAMSTIRFKAYPIYRDVTIGFRCAKGP